MATGLSVTPLLLAPAAECGRLLERGSGAGRESGPMLPPELVAVVVAAAAAMTMAAPVPPPVFMTLVCVLVRDRGR